MNITIKNGDLNSLLGILRATWADLLPPIREERVSCSIVKDKDNIETLLLFNDDELESREFVSSCKTSDDFIEAYEFILNWIRNDKSIAEPPATNGGSFFKGFWLSNDGLKTHNRAEPFLAIRSAWPFYEK